MQRISARPPLIPAHVTLRGLREAQGLTAADLAARLAERGVTVGTDHIYDVEVGRKGLSFELRLAWAEALGFAGRDVRTGAELRELVAAADAGPRTEAEAGRPAA